jgi:hypothetical protein
MILWKKHEHTLNYVIEYGPLVAKILPAKHMEKRKDHLDPPAEVFPICQAEDLRCSRRAC